MARHPVPDDGSQQVVHQLWRVESADGNDRRDELLWEFSATPDTATDYARGYVTKALGPSRSVAVLHRTAPDGLRSLILRDSNWPDGPVYRLIADVATWRLTAPASEDHYEFTALDASAAERTVQRLLDRKEWALGRRHITPAQLKITRRKRTPSHMSPMFHTLCGRADDFGECYRLWQLDKHDSFGFWNRGPLVHTFYTAASRDEAIKLAKGVAAQAARRRNLPAPEHRRPGRCPDPGTFHPVHCPDSTLIYFPSPGLSPFSAYRAAKDTGRPLYQLDLAYWIWHLSPIRSSIELEFYFPAAGTEAAEAHVADLLSRDQWKLERR